MTATEMIHERRVFVEKPDRERLPPEVARRLLWLTIRRFTQGKRRA